MNADAFIFSGIINRKKQAVNLKRRKKAGKTRLAYNRPDA
jgi:hypothetical protein